MEALLRVNDVLKSLKETRFSGIRSPAEFFDYRRISRPADLNQGISRISYNTRYFSANYGLIIVALAVYAIISKPQLLFAIGFIVFGFAAINKFAPEVTQIGEHTITQKHLYTGLFVIGIPLLILASPFDTIFFITGASGVLILGHACMLEPGVESDYATIQDTAV